MEMRIMDKIDHLNHLVNGMIEIISSIILHNIESCIKAGNKHYEWNKVLIDKLMSMEKRKRIYFIKQHSWINWSPLINNNQDSVTFSNLILLYTAYKDLSPDDIRFYYYFFPINHYFMSMIIWINQAVHRKRIGTIPRYSMMIPSCLNDMTTYIPDYFTIQNNQIQIQDYKSKLPKILLLSKGKRHLDYTVVVDNHLIYDVINKIQGDIQVSGYFGKDDVDDTYSLKSVYNDPSQLYYDNFMQDDRSSEVTFYNSILHRIKEITTCI
jgi:hypothetical protein